MTPPVPSVAPATRGPAPALATQAATTRPTTLADTPAASQAISASGATMSGTVRAPTVELTPTGTPVPPITVQVPRSTSAVPATRLPLIDLHFHPDPRWDVDGLVKLMDELNVAIAGNGPVGADTVALDFQAKHPGRFVAFAAQLTLRSLIAREGERAWTLQSPSVVSYLDQVEAGISAGRYRGIGEVFVNNLKSHPAGTSAAKYPADSPLMKRLWGMSARYRVPISVHMEATDDSVAQMERLLASDRNGTWIWAHTGHYGEPPLVRRLLQEHPNLYCELSFRESHRAGLTRIAIDNAGQLRPEWKQLLEDYPARFVIGTDVGEPSLAGYREAVEFWHRLLAQLSPAAASRIGHENAQGLISD